MEVILHVYDLSGGLARTMSMAMVGKQFDGIWHTGVVVFGKEYFFGGGIQSGLPARTPYGFPVQKISLGKTHIPEDVMTEFLQEIGPRFTFENYNVLTHNCNNFSNELAIFLTGSGIPSFILDLPKEAMATPMGAMISQMLAPKQGGGASPFPFQPAPFSAQAAASSAPSAQPSTSGVARAPASPGARSEYQKEGVASRGGDISHEHDQLELPTLDSFDRPFVLSQLGDKGAAAIERLRALQESHHQDKGTEAPAEEVQALSDLKAYLDVEPSEASPTLSRGCYRLIARVLAEWPITAWGPVLDLLRLLLLYAPVNRHYANSAGNPVPVIVKRCIMQAGTPRAVQIRGLLVAVNAFSHEPGGRAMVKEGEGAGVMESAMELISHADLATRMSAAGVLYNIARLLPKGEVIEVLQLASGLAHHLMVKTDGETCLRLVLAMARLVHRNSAAVSLLKSLEFDPENVEVDGVAPPNLEAVKKELASMLAIGV